MVNRKVLVVDDERNIRLSLEEGLSSLGLEVIAAANGEEALAALDTERPALMLLDLLMPGMGGMEVLERTARAHPEVRVVVLTAHGNVGNAVEAMKLGAADFLQKPFSLQEIRALVKDVLDREKLEADRAVSYEEHIQLAKRSISDRQLDAALAHVSRAIALNPARPEAFNLHGVLDEIAGRRNDALSNYRIALDVDSGYRPAQQNLARATRPREERRGPPALD